MTKGPIAYQELLDESQKLGIKYEMVDHPALRPLQKPMPILLVKSASAPNRCF